ncbi:MAG: ATP-binding protein [Pseudomonadota bacterium]
MQTPRKRHDLDLLWQASFSNPKELVLRYLVIAAIGAVLFAYNGDPFGPLWALGYLCGQGVLALSLWRRARLPTRLDIARGIAGCAFAIATFMWLPLYLLAFEDSTLVYCAVLGLASVVLLNMWRDEPPVSVVVMDVLTGWIVLAVVLYIFGARSGSTAELAVLTLLTVVAGGYYSVAVISARSFRVRLRQAAERSLQSQKMQALGQFAGGVAHDFNNILTVVQGNLELHEDVTDPVERRALIKEARQATERATGLISHLMGFARQANQSPETIEVEAFLRDTIALSARLLPTSVQLARIGEAKGLRMQATRDGLTSAILNLVVNARDAMDGQGEIQIRTRVLPEQADRPKEGRIISIAVADNGPGMTPNHLARAMEPFFTTKSSENGSGLGLAMAKDFVEQSGGTLQITSNTTGAQRGTAVEMRLPLDPSPV